MGFCHLGPKPSGCSKEVAALHSDLPWTGSTV